MNIIRDITIKAKKHLETEKIMLFVGMSFGYLFKLAEELITK